MNNFEKILYNKATVVGNEFEYIKQAIDNAHISGDGEFSKKCHELLERELGIQKALLTTSCTHALEMTALLLNIQPGDEIILPSFTFVSTVNAFMLRGAKPIFADIRPDTLNINEKQIESLITPRTRAIVVIHYAGVACEMDAITEIAKKHNIVIIEDNAHGLFAKYKGKSLGSIGSMSTQSFHETKNFSCGEGGALLINDEALVERAEIIREKGTNRSRFFRGMVDKYTWVDIGSSYLLSDLLAAFLYAQLEKKDAIQKKRLAVWNRYHSELKIWASKNDVRLPIVPTYCEHPAHIYYLLMPSLEIRTRFIQFLMDQNIIAVFHYLPLHLSEMGLNLGGKVGQCPVTEKVSDTLVRLPLFYSLSEEDQSRVIETILTFNSF
jgi:dTDP-4-amino-4,6-dideoxygalactose transaminase